LGILSKQVHKGVIQVHFFVADLTKRGGHRKPPGPHRGVTHWWPAPLVTGGLVSAFCYVDKWALFGTLVVLYTAALRGLTVPEYAARSTDTIRHRWAMELAHYLIRFVPWMVALKRARRPQLHTHAIYFTYWRKIDLPVGKLMTIFVAADLALLAIQYPWVVAHGGWLGVVVALGMYLHIYGDAFTEMGVPGIWLDQFWRLPKWLAFRAGGPFEILCLWVPMAGLGIFLIPGLFPRELVMSVQTYIVWGLGVLTGAAIIIELIARHIRKQRRRPYVHQR